MSTCTLRVEPLTAAAFAPFGQVIEAAAGAPQHSINGGDAQRFHDLALLDTAAGGGRALVNIFRARPRTLPLRLSCLERHLLGTQLFMPLAGQRFLVVVAAPGPLPLPAALRCFVAATGQGVNLARGTWHHPLLALDGGGDFLVVDRGDPTGAIDCEVVPLDDAAVWVAD